MTCQCCAAWFSAIGTVGTLVVAVWQLFSGARKDRKARRQSQAEKLTAWVDETDEFQILSNRSGNPVYDAVLTFVIKDGDGRRSPVGQDRSYRHTFRTVPPGDWQFLFPEGWRGMHAYPGVELAFRDAAGHSWIRGPRGELKELDQGPIEYYGIGYPYVSGRLTPVRDD